MTARAGAVRAQAAGPAASVLDDLAPRYRRAFARRRIAPGCRSGRERGLGEGAVSEGVVRGAAEALAVVAGFAVLGRTLGLRR
jgi:hypothetical protein